MSSSPRSRTPRVRPLATERMPPMDRSDFAPFLYIPVLVSCCCELADCLGITVTEVVRVYEALDGDAFPLESGYDDCDNRGEVERKFDGLGDAQQAALRAAFQRALGA